MRTTIENAICVTEKSLPENVTGMTEVLPTSLRLKPVQSTLNESGYSHNEQGIPTHNNMARITSDSMYPLFMCGDTVFYKVVKSLKSLLIGDICFVAFESDGIIRTAIRRIYISEKQGYIRLDGDNPNYSPLEIPTNNIRSIALVTGCFRCIN